MNVLMVDDHIMFLQGLRNLLGVLAPDLQVDCADSLDRADQFLAGTTYGLVLLDWHLADCDGELAMARLRDAGCVAPIVVLSGETGDALIRRALDIGAAGFIPKTYSSEMMISALERVLDGNLFLPPEGPKPTDATAPALENDPRLAGLTPRQLDVYRAASRGLPNKLIARELGIAGSTVKSHLAAVYAALGVRNRTEAAFQSSREGMRIFESMVAAPR